MTHRRPRTAVHSSALPSLAALLASGVAVEGCGDPATAATARRERLTEHAESAASAFRDGRFANATRDVAVGLGLLDPPVQHIVSRGGAAGIVDPQPPVPSGGIAPVQPMPPQPPPVVHQEPMHPAVPGGMRRVAPDRR